MIVHADKRHSLLVSLFYAQNAIRVIPRDGGGVNYVAHERRLARFIVRNDETGVCRQPNDVVIGKRHQRVYAFARLAAK